MTSALSLMRVAACIAVVALPLAACGPAQERQVDGAWIRLPAVPGRPGAAYFTLHGGAADATLVAVASPRAARAELHESMANGMRPVVSVPVPAGGIVSFAPGGRHVMLFDLDPRLPPGSSAALTLSFADGRTLSTTAPVVGAADPAP